MHQVITTTTSSPCQPRNWLARIIRPTRLGLLLVITSMAGLHCKSGQPVASSTDKPPSPQDKVAAASTIGITSSEAPQTAATVEVSSTTVLAPGSSTLVDLDGDGSPEKVVVAEEGDVFVGAEKIHINYGVLDNPIKLLDFNTAKPGKVIMATTYGGDDDDVGFVIYSFDGHTKEAGSFYYRDNNRPFLKGGLLHNSWVEQVPQETRDEYGNQDCEIVSYEATYALRKGKLVEVSKKAINREISICTACPFVYVWDGDKWNLVGEILRNLSTKDMETTQQLTLPPNSVFDGRVRIRLAEEKRETTYLDAFELEVDGRRVAPSQCSDGAVFCNRDAKRMSLSQGESVTFDFPVPEDSPRSIRVLAHGYYLPN